MACLLVGARLGGSEPPSMMGLFSSSSWNMVGGNLRGNETLTLLRAGTMVTLSAVFNTKGGAVSVFQYQGQCCQRHTSWAGSAR